MYTAVNSVADDLARMIRSSARAPSPHWGPTSSLDVRSTVIMASTLAAVASYITPALPTGGTAVRWRTFLSSASLMGAQSAFDMSRQASLAAKSWSAHAHVWANNATAC